MSAGVGWAIWHYSKLYCSQFKEPVPVWLRTIELPIRLKLIKQACSLGQKLPAEVLHNWLTDLGSSISNQS
jgi:hypothetical protein